MKAKHRFFEPIPKPDEPGEQVNLLEVGGVPSGFARALHYRYTAFRHNGQAFACVVNSRTAVPRSTTAMGAEALLCDEDRRGIPPGGEQWYKVTWR